MAEFEQHSTDAGHDQQKLISLEELQQKKELLTPTTTIVRSTPILSHGWEESSVEKKDLQGDKSETQQQQVHQNVEHLIPEKGWREMHGFLGDRHWSAPIKISHCASESRPGYASKLAHEFEDTPEVLLEKVELLATLIKRSSNCLVYSGAGISTSSGINDYASQRGSVALENDTRPRLRSPYEARPTLAHHAVVALYRSNLVKYWVQQNHDGLPQKAGLPQNAINEIHGAWYDPSNPVVAMNGNLRGDLFEDMLRWENQSDLTISLGTTMCGMNSDRVFTTIANKALKAHQNRGSKNSLAIGGVIINLQQTQHDSISCLRIFSKLDIVMQMLIEELGLSPLLPLEQYSIYNLCDAGILSEADEDIFDVKYDRDGFLIEESNRPSSSHSLFQIFSTSKSPQLPPQTTRLDLRIGSRVKLVSGPHGGDEGEVIGKNREGHYRIQFMHTIGKVGLKKPFETVMGSWWVEAAVRGTVRSIPVVNIPSLR